MLRIELDAAALGRVRFAISPLAIAWDALMLLSDADASRRQRILTRSRTVLRERRLVLLESCFNHGHAYVPDFLTPLPTRYDGDLDCELHQVATTSAERVRSELGAMVDGPDKAPVDADPAARTLLRMLDRGEDHLAERFAAELADFFAAALAADWPTLRGRLESDIARRARDASRRGVGDVLADLHSCLVWDGAALGLTRGPHGTMSAQAGVVLTPIAFHIVMAAGGVPPSPLPLPPHLMYPAVRDAGGANRSPVSAAHALIGTTRTVLLQDLDRPRTTTELARRHSLAESTVAYHLGILHRSGLATRIREGRNVLYQQSRQGATLVARAH